MKDFVVAHHLVTPMTLSTLKSQQSSAGRWKFDLTGQGRQIIVQEFVTPYQGIRRATGLDFYTKLKAKDEAQARAEAEDTIATLYGLMAFQGRTYIQKVRHLSTLEIVDGKDDPFSYSLYENDDSLRTDSRARLKQETFNVIWNADGALLGADKAKRKQLHVAMAMLRNGTASGGEISKFLQYWIGFAALDHHLKDIEEGANIADRWSAIFARHDADYDVSQIKQVSDVEVKKI